MPIRQLFPGGSTVPLQPSPLILKSAELVPVILAEIAESGAVPTLLRVMVVEVVLEICWEPKPIAAGIKFTNGTVPRPCMGID